MYPKVIRSNLLATWLASLAVIVSGLLVTRGAEALEKRPPTAPVYPSTQPTARDRSGAVLEVKTSSLHPALLQPIVVDACLRNLLDDPLLMSRMNNAKVFILILCDEHGDPVPLTRYGHELYDPRTIERGSEILLQADKGEAFYASLPLNRIYDLTMPGKYTLVVQAYPYQRGGAAKVKIESSAVVIQVHPRLYNPDTIEIRPSTEHEKVVHPQQAK